MTSKQSGNIHTVNARSAAAVEKAATDMRGEIITSSHAGVIAYLQAQIAEDEAFLEANGYRNPEADITVRLDHTAFPFEEHDLPIPSLCLELFPDVMLGQERHGVERMLVHVPVPVGTSLDIVLDPDSIAVPDFVVIERYDADDNLTCYLVRQDRKVEEFQNAFHTGEEVRGEVLMARKVLEWVSKRVSPSDSVVSGLLVDLTNWTAQPHRPSSVPLDREVA